jgi:hypothetical protein
MSDNSNTCEYYNAGMCIYVNHRFAIFEKCHFKNVSGELKIKCTNECLQKKVIERIEASELENGL